jgi:hypothetical protein
VRALRKLRDRLPLTFLHCSLARIFKIIVPKSGAAPTAALILVCSGPSG